MKIAPKQYARLMIELAEELPDQKMDEALGDVALLIREHRDIGKLDKIIDEFGRQYDNKYGVVNATVTSMNALSKGIGEKLKGLIAEKRGTSADKVILQEELDPSLLGGMSIRIGDDVWDGSVRHRIEKMKSSLMM
jgi:F-type H+-transporting ATPase subunit delta